MANGILGSADKKAISEFRKDLLQMLRIGKWVDKYYAESQSDLDIYIKKFNSLIESFNKKYKNIKLKLAIKTNEARLRIFLNEKGVKECFANSASKIAGVQSIGSSNFGAAAVSDAAAFAGELEKAKSKLCITYYSLNTGTSNVFLQYDPKEKKVELFYELREIENEPNPEFQLAAYYALNEGYNKKVDLNEEGSAFGFFSIPTHVEKAEYIRKFDPHIGE